MVRSYSGPPVNEPLFFGWHLGFISVVIISLNAFVFLVWGRFLRSELDPGSKVKEFGKIRFRHPFYGNEVLIADINGPVLPFLGTSELPIVHMGKWPSTVICSFELPRLLLSNVTGVVGNSHGVSPPLDRASDLKAQHGSIHSCFVSVTAVVAAHLPYVELSIPQMPP